MIEGQISRISGPVVQAKGMVGIKIRDLVAVGDLGLIGEVIEVEGDEVAIQVYEETDGLTVGEPVKSEATPFLAELGPGLLGSIYDGIQRPLEVIQAATGQFIVRGTTSPALDRERRWAFTPTVEVGTQVSPGDIIGHVQESPTIEHRILVPPRIEGRITKIEAGEYTVEEPVAVVGDGTEIRMMHRWPIRVPRPYREKLSTSIPLITGQRILDVLFPVAKGGNAIIPGGFGTGKTVAEHSLSKWSDADVVIYVGCGERGNEMTEVLTEFPKLEDPRTGAPLMARTILIANTSNMPVAARETSIYTGITLAEYYRDMGHDVALFADSTSRWAEALREISGRLEEIPAEEGYPSYLASRIAEFYERAGRVITLGSLGSDTDGREGTVTVIGAVSPPGADFSEPVTQNSLRVAGTFWSLDTRLAQRRHFPAIHWLDSYSQYLQDLADWYRDEVSDEWTGLRGEMIRILEEEDELQKIVQLVGKESLSDPDRLLLEVAQAIKEDFLQQNAFHDVDAHTPLKKQFYMMDALIRFYQKTQRLLETTSFEALMKLLLWERLARMKYLPNDDFEAAFQEIFAEIEALEAVEEEV
ncbi:MAG: V-type ATP synthase subunit A [Candidatus Bipolaricaulia bacterium]